MALKIITYEEWLALSPEERERAHCSWNPYSGENRHIPREAARRLKESSGLPIVAVRVGIYHGGEYILNPELWPKDFHLAPPWFAEEFDGFRLGYCEHNPSIQWEEEGPD